MFLIDISAEFAMIPATMTSKGSKIVRVISKKGNPFVRRMPLRDVPITGSARKKIRKAIIRGKTEEAAKRLEDIAYEKLTNRTNLYKNSQGVSVYDSQLDKLDKDINPVLQKRAYRKIISKQSRNDAYSDMVSDTIEPMLNRGGSESIYRVERRIREAIKKGGVRRKPTPIKQLRRYFKRDYN